MTSATSTTVGKMLYTESTAKSVNERMTATQERLAQKIRSDGDSQAETIVSEANSISEQLKSFANTVATRIEILGIREANVSLVAEGRSAGLWPARWPPPG